MSLPKETPPNDLPSKLHFARMNLQKSITSNKISAPKPKHSTSSSQKENSLKIDKKPIKERLSSLSRMNSMAGTSDTSFLNKNIEDFLLTKTQPLENIQMTRYSLLSSPPKTEGTLDMSYFNIENSSVYTEILEKMKDFKKQRGKDMEEIINYMLKQHDKKKEMCYDFLQEKDLLTLRYLVQILYDKVEFVGKDKIEALEQKILFSQRNSSILHDEMLEKNIQINTISTKFYILLQKAKDFLWLVGETRKELKNLLTDEKGALNFTRKTALDNLLKEFDNLEKKMQEFDLKKEKGNTEELSFFKKFEESRKNIKENIRGICKEREREREKQTPLKENKAVLNKSFCNKSLEVFEKELKKSQEKILFLIDEKSAIEKNLYDSQLKNRELTNKLNELKHKLEEKECEITGFYRRLDEKDEEIIDIMEKLRVSEENLASESGVKDKKDTKLQMIEKELQEIKKLTGLKENEFYMLDLKNKTLEGELQRSLKRIKEFEKEREIVPEKKENPDKKADLEIVIQYLSMIILSKSNSQTIDQEETIQNIKRLCGENFFQILQEIYLKINDYEVEVLALKEKIKEQSKNKNIASQAALYFAKNLLGFFELIEKNNDEKGFRSMLKEKFNNLNEMKSRYMEVINELTFCESDTPSKNANEMSFVQKDENPKKFESYSASKKKNHFINEKENVSRPPLNDRSNNNLSFSSLNFSEHNSNIKKREKAQSNNNENGEIYLFLLNQAASIEQLLKNY